MLKVAVLVSGGGTNLQAILDSVDRGEITNAEIALVISNKRDAYALERAAAKKLNPRFLYQRSMNPERHMDRH